MSPKGAAIIPAAGSGSRMKAQRPKQYLDLAGKPIIIHTVAAFHNHCDIGLVIVVVPQNRVEATRELLESWKLTEKIEVVAGGTRRQDSVRIGLEQVGNRADVVLVHDGARPLIGASLISSCIKEARAHGAVIAAVQVKDTLKRSDSSGRIKATVDRENLWQAQTPQAARIEYLQKAFAEAGDRDVTDEAMLLEMAGFPVKIIFGSEKNIKITQPEDLMIAEKIITQAACPAIRIGHGFDAHRLVPDRALVLAGVEISHPMGLAGHSDADVVTHALCDAILGAMGKGDIGKHFPDSSAEFKDIYSILLLRQVIASMQEGGYVLGNADITVICQAPKLSPYISEMQKTIADACQTPPGQVNIKATTTEKMGYTGREEGIGCHAVVTLVHQPSGQATDT